jgi:mannose-6-phosphate isomerase
MYIIKGCIQHYAWGGYTYIPNLLSIPNPEQNPHAEYWLGVHAGGPARVRLSDNAHTGLPEMIRSEPRRYLGQAVLDKFGDLPYLLKILDVRGMLSIQVHPNKEEARKGFERENAEGIPLNAPHRNYRDSNHKPEVMLALGEFWLLHGFKENLADSLEGHDQLGILLPVLESRGLKGLYQYVMELPQSGVDAILQPLAMKIIPLYEQGSLSKSSPDFWAARVMKEKAPDFHHLDRGIFSIYFFNIIQLRAGEAIFQPAGVPHAYLEGQNIELMSNSDNVLRAGLTPKHMDIPELMKHTSFEYVRPTVLSGEREGPWVHYPCPVDDFRLDTIDLKAGEVFEVFAQGPEIWLQLGGHAQWQGLRTIETRQGQAIFLLPGEKAELLVSAASRFCRASVPL